MKLDPQYDRLLSNALTSLESLIALAPVAFGKSDAAASFWYREGGEASRIAFLGPTGGQVHEIVNSLTGMSLSEADLRESICEAIEPAMVRWLFEDGTLADNRKSHVGASILQMHGGRWQGMTVSCGLLNVGLSEGSMEPAAWVDRISIPVIVTSARAVLGLAESAFIRRFQKEKRFFTLLVTGIEGNPDQVVDIKKEIDEMKIKPFMEEVGHFSVVYWQPGQSWMSDLSTIVNSEVGKAHCHQLIFVVQRWIDKWSAILEQLWLEDQKKRKLVNEVRIHLADTTARLIDIARRIATNVNLNITDCYSFLENTSDKTAAHFVANISETLESVEDLVLPMKKAWIALDEAIAKMPQDLEQGISTAWNKELDAFSGTYLSILSRQQIEMSTFRSKAYDAALEAWQQLSLEKFSAHIVSTLEEMQTNYQEKTLNNMGNIVKDKHVSDWRSILSEVIKKVKSMSTTTEALEHEVSSMITEALRRYVRDRMSRIRQAIDQDIQSWFADELRSALDAWRVAINGQLDEHLSSLKSDEYKGMLLPHREIWRSLSLQAHTDSC